MKVLSRLLALFLIISVLALVGCFGGDDDDDYVASTGEILLSAEVDAPAAAVFAAALRGSVVGELRAAKSTKFKALIKLAGNKVATPDLDLSADGKKLTMAETSVTATTGKQQVTIEVVPVADETKPVLKTIVVAEVVAGTPADEKGTKVDTETTAKAVAYEAWDKKATNTIDEFVPATADITALKTQIETTLGNSIDGSKDLTDSAIQTAATEAAKDVEPVVEPVATQNRFSGNYRVFYLNASTQNRWVGMSELSVNNGQITDTVKVDPDPAEINQVENYSVTESAGNLVFSGDSSNRGVVSPSGNLAMVHKWVSSDPYIGLYVKKPTSASNATLNGTYRFYEFFDEVTASFVPKQISNMTVFSMTFNGNGTYSNHSVVYKEAADDWVPELTGTYSVSSDGKISVGPDSASEFMQVSADGNVIVFVKFEADNSCNFTVGIKQDSSLVTADANGNWLYACVSAGPGTPYSFTDGQLVTFNNGAGTWTNGVSDVSSEIPQDATRNLVIGANGTLNVDSDGALAANKELIATVSKNGTMRYLTLSVKK